MSRKIIIWIIIISFFVGGLGSLLLGRFVMPYLGNHVPALSFLNKLVTNSPIIINRTQQVQLNEGVNLIDLIKQTGNITVSIYDNKNVFLGNGVIMTSDGLVFSSASIIPKQTQFSIVTNDGQKLTATLKTKDAKTNLAILTAAGSGLPTGQIDNAVDLEPGQRVIYLGRGNVQFEHLAQAGFVTQSLANQQGLRQISSDAVVTPDYFGGPIINLTGHIVGLVIDATHNIIGEDLQTSLTAYLAK